MSRASAGGRSRCAASEARRTNAMVDALRSRLWPVPTAGVVIATLAGIGLPELEDALQERIPTLLSALLFGGGSDAAREVLGAIATSMITVTSLTFSLTVVTLQLASSQYTPRLLRTFTADRVVQNTLALFLATFVYALAVLRTVRNDGDDATAFVPRIAVTLGFLLAIASVLALVAFLSHLVRQIRIETMLDHVRSDARRTAELVLEPRTGERRPLPAPSTPQDATLIPAMSSGFLVGVDEEALMIAATEHGVVIELAGPVGATVTAGVPVAYYWSPTPQQSLDGDRVDELGEAVTSALDIGFERTANQDIAYGLRQLTDVMVRALSPGINDPTTAVHGLSSCSAVLCHLVGYRMGRDTIADEDGNARLVLPRPGLPELLDLVCTQPQLYGGKDPLVLAAIVSMLSDLAWTTTVAEHRRAVGQRLRRVEATIDEQAFDAIERRRLQDLVGGVDQLLMR